jgi:hypothetical protein
MQYWPKTADQKKQGLAFLIGEGTSFISAPGVLLFCENVLPGQMETIKRSLAKSIVEPHFEFFNKVASWFDPHKAKQSGDVSQDPVAPVDRASRSYEICNGMVKYSVANFIGGTAISLGVQTIAEHLLKTPALPARQKYIMRGTEFLGHYGSAVILGTIFSPFAERAKEVVSKILSNVGMSKKDADNSAFATVYTVLPEFAGSVVGWLTMTAMMGRSSPSLGK